jgi:hypothetical protein
LARRTFTLRCGPAAARALCEAVQGFADAAYPPGGSECGQVARGTLMDLARTLEEAAGRDAEPELSVRLRAMLRSAVRWHFDPSEDATESGGSMRGELLLSALAGSPVSDAQFAEAARRDGLTQGPGPGAPG